MGKEASCSPGSSCPRPGGGVSSCELNPILIWGLYHSRSSAPDHPLDFPRILHWEKAEEGGRHMRSPRPTVTAACPAAACVSLPSSPASAGRCLLALLPVPSRGPAPVGATLSTPPSRAGAKLSQALQAASPGLGLLQGLTLARPPWELSASVPNSPPLGQHSRAPTGQPLGHSPSPPQKLIESFLGAGSRVPPWRQLLLPPPQYPLQG